MKTLILVASSLAVAVLAAGCTVLSNNSSTTYSGTQVSDVTLAQMEVGKTTKSWVVATLGAPTSVSQVDDNTELLRYTATRTTEREAGMIVVVASKQKTQKRETVYLEFKDGVLKRYWKAEE